MDRDKLLKIAFDINRIYENETGDTQGRQYSRIHSLIVEVCGFKEWSFVRKIYRYKYINGGARGLSTLYELSQLGSALAKREILRSGGHNELTVSERESLEKYEEAKTVYNQNIALVKTLHCLILEYFKTGTVNEGIPPRLLATQMLLSVRYLVTNYQGHKHQGGLDEMFDMLSSIKAEEDKNGRSSETDDDFMVVADSAIEFLSL